MVRRLGHGISNETATARTMQVILGYSDRSGLLDATNLALAHYLTELSTLLATAMQRVLFNSSNESLVSGGKA